MAADPQELYAYYYGTPIATSGQWRQLTEVVAWWDFDERNGQTLNGLKDYQLLCLKPVSITWFALPV